MQNPLLVHILSYYKELLTTKVLLLVIYCISVSCPVLVSYATRFELNKYNSFAYAIANCLA